MKSTVLLFALLPLSAVAQERILGLLEIPVLHAGLNEGNTRFADQATGSVTLYIEPNINSEVVAVVRDRRELESGEHGYELVSAVVFDQAGDARNGFYYQLRTTGEDPVFGWIWQGDAGLFRSLTTLISTHGLGYLTDSWDGKLYEDPGWDSATSTFSELGERPDFRLISLYNVGSERWYLVALVRGSCTGDPLEVISTGWIPEYAESGGNTAWYYSRGC